MAKKTGGTIRNETPREETFPPKAGGSTVRFAAIGVLVLGGAFFLYASLTEGPQTAPASASIAADHGHDHASSPKDPGLEEKFRYFEDPAEAHPLPVTL
ncbi:MAG TPA: hypothetical protein VGC53_01790, partial [Vicinamibacteria bacterium]